MGVSLLRTFARARAAGGLTLVSAVTPTLTAHPSHIQPTPSGLSTPRSDATSSGKRSFFRSLVFESEGIKHILPVATFILLYPVVGFLIRMGRKEKVLEGQSRGPGTCTSQDMVRCLWVVLNTGPNEELAGNQDQYGREQRAYHSQAVPSCASVPATDLGASPLSFLGSKGKNYFIVLFVGLKSYLIKRMLCFS